MREPLLLLVVIALTLAMGHAGQATPGAVLVLHEDGVPLRVEGRPSAPVLLSLERGQRLLEFRRQDGWVEVAVFGMVGVRGWLHSDAVAAEPWPSDPPSAPPAPSESTAEAAASRAFVLGIAGTPALAFRAICRVVAADGEQRTARQEGWVPERITGNASAVSCRVRKTDVQGRLRVTLRFGETPPVSAQTRAAFNWVRVRSDGPWGGAGGLRGTVGLLLPRALDTPRPKRPIDSRPRPLPTVRR